MSVNQISFDESAAQINIAGTSGIDQVTVSYTSTASINVRVKSGGVTQEADFNAASVTSVSFSGEDGNDVFTNTTDVRSVVFGGPGDDRLTGGLGDDTLFGEDGHDVLYGEAGNDLLYGLEGNDVLFGGVGDDKLMGGIGDDVLKGEDGHDVLYGQEDNDLLYGLEGNDYVFGGIGDDKLMGGIGDDVLKGEDGHDVLYGEAGNDLLYALEGNDLLFGGIGDDLLVGGDGNDSLHGCDGNDLLLGSAGNDELYAGAGLDVLVGQAGDDLLVADSGNSVLIGGEGRDNLVGGAADDLLVGGSTIFDGNIANLQTLLLQWTANASYAERVAIIEGTESSVQLQSDSTVLDDQIPDTILGGDGSDWFFLTGSMPYYSPVTGEDELSSDHHAAEVIHTLPVLEGFDLVSALDNLRDVQDTELIHSKVPHTGDFSRQKEHLSLFQLVRYDQVTHIAVANGNWSSPSTWQNGIVPTAGAHVLIPIGVQVTIDRVISAPLATVRVDGTLSFSTSSNSELGVDTIVVTASGAFEMGTALRPIASNVTARLLITDNGPIDRTWDPYGISRGLISHGRTTIYGRTVLEQSTVQGNITAGTTKLTLTAAPLGWKVGDQIVVAGTVAGAQQDEVRQILEISGNIITIPPLTYDHITPSPDLSVHVAHLTRNAVIESESSTVDRRGHVMFMHSKDVDIYYAGFYKLGRTNKLEVVNDAVVDANWVLQSGTGTNPRGRYSVHFHRNGIADDGNPAVVRGSAVIDSPGWGFVNHSSFVEFTNNVAFDVKGAAFVTEVGDEIGSFRGNIAIHVTGSGEETDSRLYQQDFGHQGDGFWFQGAGIAVTDNVSAGSEGNAFAFYSRGLKEEEITQTFRSDNLADPSIAAGAESIKVDFVPVREFARNIGVASGVGLTMRYNLRDASHQQFSVIEDSTFWNNETGINLNYSQQIVLRNLTVIHDPAVLPQTGIGGNAISRKIVYENLTVSGYKWGINVARAGSSVISGGYYNNLANFVIGTPSADDRTVVITGPIEFGELPDTVVGKQGQSQVFLRPDLLPGVSSAFYRNSVVLDFGSFDNQRAYYTIQEPNAVPFPTAGDGIQPAYVGLTTQQLQDRFGLTIGGEIAPPSAITIPGIIGLVEQIGP